MKNTPRIVLTLLIALGLAPLALGADGPPRSNGPLRSGLGKSVKLTILVDKVLQPQAGWKTEEWMIEASAEAGFNVYSPRVGHERLDEVRQVTAWCEKYGIYHMPWMRGTLSAPSGPEADGKRVVWASGNEQLLWSVNSDEFWEWTTKYIVEYAKMSAENEHIMGVFLDYENYAKNKGGNGNLYSLSYDDLILGKFAAAQGIELPELALGKRKAWLEEKGLHDAFEAFQVGHWRERCRALRKAVDAHNPAFQFCIYPAPGTPFMVKATYPEWSTEQAPIILADASTYGRPSRYVPEQEALEQNKAKLLDHMEVAKAAGIPFVYSGGIDPVVRGADPEFSGKNAVAISEVTDGYWIFYEGPTYTKQDHKDYWKWFSWANKAIAEGKFEVQHAPRETAEDWTLDIFNDKATGMRLVPPPVTGEKVEYPLIKMRHDNLLFLSCKAGQEVEVVLKHQAVSRYKSVLGWDLRNASMEKIANGHIPFGKTEAVRFTPEADGVYLLGADAGHSAYSVESSNVPLAIYANEGASFIQGGGPLFFHVPEGAKEFSIRARGYQRETVRVTVFAPNGEEAATGQTTLNESWATVKVKVGDFGPGTWSLKTGKADAGTLEDNEIYLDAQLPGTLSLAPEHVFASR